MEIILASQSPRRKDLLKEIFNDFRVIPSNVDESLINGKTPQDFAKKAAAAKAQEVGKHYPDCLIIGADTIVVLDNKIFGKPKDYQDAKRILQTLSNTTHEVITGVALYNKNIEKLVTDFEATKVTIHKLPDTMIEEYLAESSFMDKAGAYAIQNKKDPFIKKIDGDFNNVVGLPLEKLKKMLDDFTK